MTNVELIEDFNSKGLEYPTWIIGVTPDLDVGLGLSWIWQLPRDHPLTSSADIHDLEYQVRGEKTSSNADYRLLRNCLKLAKGNKRLLIQSYLFYAIARSVGVVRW